MSSMHSKGTAFSKYSNILQLTPPAELDLEDSAALAGGFACFCAGFLAGASFLAPSVDDAGAAAAGLAAAAVDPPTAGAALISAFSAHSFTLKITQKYFVLFHATENRANQDAGELLYICRYSTEYSHCALH